MRIRYIITIICIFLTTTSFAKTKKADEVKANQVNELSWPQYDDWNTVNLQGKLRMAGLPVSPSIKIFMKKGSNISISLSAIFVGEVGRVDLSTDSVMIVNRMNKTYCEEGIRNFLKYYPGAIGDIQDLLLGRFFMPGYNVNEDSTQDMVDLYFEEEQIIVVPKDEAQIDGVKYGFIVDKFFNPLNLVVIPEGRDDTEISVSYNYDSGGYDLQFVLPFGNKTLTPQLELKNPQWDGQPLSPVKLDKKYRKLSLQEFMSAISH